MKAILSGHTRGIGEAFAGELLARGIAVLALARGGHAELAARFPDKLNQVRLDLADPAALRAWLDSAELGRFLADADELLLINNAGMLTPIGPPGRQDPEVLVRAIDLNVTAPLLLCDGLARRHAGPLRVMHLSSGAGRNAYAGWSIYGATKAALDHHARGVQMDARPQLRIASVAPGVVDTEMQSIIREASPEDLPLRARFVALKEDGKLFAPRDVAARLVGYLLGEDFGKEPVVDLRTLGAA